MEVELERGDTLRKGCNFPLDVFINSEAPLTMAHDQKESRGEGETFRLWLLLGMAIVFQQIAINPLRLVP